MRSSDCQGTAALTDESFDLEDSLIPWPADLASVMVIDGPDGEVEITDFMVRRACERIDAEQASPFRKVGGYAPARARVTRRAS